MNWEELGGVNMLESTLVSTGEQIMMMALIGLGVIVAALILLVIVAKRRKKQEKNEEEEL